MEIFMKYCKHILENMEFANCIFRIKVNIPTEMHMIGENFKLVNVGIGSQGSLGSIENKSHTQNPMKISNFPFQNLKLFVRNATN